MESIRRLKNRAIAKAITRIPALSRAFTGAYKPVEAGEIPWTPLSKPLRECKVALVTTAGVHHRDQPPFDMEDKDGDPSFRVIDATRPLETLMITHDYYDHADADRDMNIVFPMERLRELEAQGVIGGVSDAHLGFMGHIVGPHIDTLLGRTAPEAAEILKAAGADVVLLTPG